MGVEPAIPGPVKGRAVSGLSSDFNRHGYYSPTVVIIDPSCSRTQIPDMALGSNSGQDATIALVAAQVTQIKMALTAAWPLDTNMVSGD